MTTLVTGGTGFIGSALVRELLARGEAVRCLVRAGSAARNLDGRDAERVEGDITDTASLRRALKGVARVYHLAALYAIWRPRAAAFYRVNEEGTRNVLAACRQAGVDRIVYCSSVAALGAHGPQPADETARFNLAWTGDNYYISKYRAEQVALQFARQGLPVVMVNPSVPVGARDVGPTPSGQIIIDIVRGRLPAYLDGGLNLIDVTGLRGGHGGRHGNRAGRRKIHPGQPQHAAQGVLRSHRPRWPAAANRRCCGSRAGPACASEIRLPGPGPSSPAGRRLTTAAWARIGSGYSWWDAAKARRELGLGQRPIEESVAEALDWFQTSGYQP